MSSLAQDGALARDMWLADLRATLVLGWPMVLTNLGQIALTTTDVIVLGRLGAHSLAVGTLGANLYFAVLLFTIGLLTATSPMIAAAVGRGLHVVRDVRRTFRQGLWSALIVALPCWLLLWNGRSALLLLGQEPALAADAEPFLRTLQWGLLPTLGYVALRSFVSALERPGWALLVTAAAIVFNVGANWVLVFGHLGVPALGLRGSGLATTLSNTFMFTALALIVGFGPRFRRYYLFGNLWRPDWPRLMALWRLGLPIGATLALESAVFSAAVFLMGQFGAVSIAAHSIAIQIAATTFMVPLGLGQTATIRVSLARGAGDSEAVTRAGWSAFALAVTFMAVMSLLMLAAPRVLIGGFIDTVDPANETVITTAVAFLAWAAVFQIADGAQVVGAGMLRGLHDTRVPMLYAAFGYWVVGMSLSLLLAFGLHFGGVGIWIGLAAGLTAVAWAMIWRWTRRERLRQA